MNRIHYIAISAAVVLAALVYIFFPPKGKPMAENQTETSAQPQQQQEQGFDFEAYLQKVNSSFSADSQAVLKKMTADADFEGLIGLYHNKGESVAEAYYTLQQAQRTGKAAAFERAGDLFQATSSLTDRPDMAAYLVENAVLSYKNAYQQDSLNVKLKMKFAASVIEQGANPMQGIGLLLDIVKKDPANADAQLMLAKFAMMSGQFEKAIERLEKVISLRPQSNDALFLLAMAHENQGNKEKAIELLEKCSRQEKNPELRKEIEGYITKLKGS